MLVFLRVSEQMGFAWESRVTSSLVDANLAWISENKDAVVNVRELDFIYIGAERRPPEAGSVAGRRQSDAGTAADRRPLVDVGERRLSDAGSGSSRRFTDLWAPVQEDPLLGERRPADVSTLNACPLCREGFDSKEALVAHVMSMRCHVAAASPSLARAHSATAAAAPAEERSPPVVAEELSGSPGSVCTFLPTRSLNPSARLDQAQRPHQTLCGPLVQCASMLRRPRQPRCGGCPSPRALAVGTERIWRCPLSVTRRRQTHPLVSARRSSLRRPLAAKLAWTWRRDLRLSPHPLLSRREPA